MTTTVRTLAVGVFTEHAQAERAIEELRRAGFTEDQIGFVTRDPNIVARDVDDSTSTTSIPNAATGAVGGGIIGGVLGAVTSLLIPGLGPALAGGILAATLGGAAIGVLAGGLAGSLVHMGVPEEEARYYQEQLTAGRAIVTVNASGRYSEAINILRAAGALDSSIGDDNLLDIGSLLPGLYNADMALGVPPVVVPPAGAMAGGATGPTGSVQPLAGIVPIIHPATDEVHTDPVEETDTTTPSTQEQVAERPAYDSSPPRNS